MVDLTKKKTLGEYETGALANGDTVVTYRSTNAVGEKVFLGNIVAGTAASIADGTSTALKMYSDKALKDAVNTGAIPVGTSTEIETGTDTTAKLYAPDQLNSAIDSLIETAVPDGTKAQIIAGTDTTERKYTPADINGAVKDIAVAQYAGRTAMKAATGLAAGDVVYLSEGGRSGTFEYLVGDYSAEVAADTLEGVYVALDSDSDGSEGVLKRRLNGRIPSTSMFGGVVGSLTAGLDYILVDSDIVVTTDTSTTTKLIEFGGTITVADGITLSVLDYESNGKYFIIRETTDSVVTGLYANDSSMVASVTKPGQTAFEFNPLYNLNLSSSGYVSDITFSTQDVPQEHGELYARVKFRGALGQFRFLFKNAAGSTTKTVNVYPVGSPSSFNATRTAALFNNDDIEKEVIIFSGTNFKDDGFLPKLQISIHPSSDYNTTLQVDILEVKIGYMNSRHTSRTPSRTPLGLKTMSVREGDSSLWFNDDDDSRIREIISGGLKYGLDSIQIVMLFKAAINSDLTINHAYFSRFEKMLWWLSNNGLAVNVCTNHIFGDSSEPDIIVYDDQILTAPERLSLKNRMIGFMKLLAPHPSVKVIEVCNEANLVFDDESVLTDITAPKEFLVDMIDAVHENTDKFASVSFSGGGLKGLYSLIDFGQDIIDMHAYDGISTTTVRPVNWPIISSEHGSQSTTSAVIGLDFAQEYSETFGPWWRYVTPGEGSFDQGTRTGNALALAGKFLPTLNGDTTAYASDLSAGSLATTAGITRLQDVSASASLDPTEYIDASGTWVNGFLIP